MWIQWLDFPEFQEKPRGNLIHLSLPNWTSVLCQWFGHKINTDMCINIEVFYERRSNVRKTVQGVRFKVYTGSQIISICGSF